MFLDLRNLSTPSFGSLTLLPTRFLLGIDGNVNVRYLEINRSLGKLRSLSINENLDNNIQPIV